MASLCSVKAQEGGSLHAAKKDIRYNADAALAGFGLKGFLRVFDWIPQLDSIKVQTNIIVGDKDWINPPSQADIMHKSIPNSTLKIVEGSGHFVWVDKAGEYSSSVCAAIDRDCAEVYVATL